MRCFDLVPFGLTLMFYILRVSCCWLTLLLIVITFANSVSGQSLVNNDWRGADTTDVGSGWKH